jgi:hypothetical protein
MSPTKPRPVPVVLLCPVIQVMHQFVIVPARTTHRQHQRTPVLTGERQDFALAVKLRYSDCIMTINSP